MAYRVGFQGLEITCDSAEELRVAITTLLGIAGDAKVESSARQVSDQLDGAGRWTADRFGRFLKFARGRQKRLLALLMDNPDGVTDEVLRRELGFKTNNALAGVVTGLVKNARKVGVGSREVLIRNRVHIGDALAHEYHLAPAFVEIAKQYGWPRKSSVAVADLSQG